MSGKSVVRKAIGNLCDQIHRADPGAAFSFELWNGESFRYHGRPKVTLRPNTEQSAKALLSKGFLGFGESYMTGDLEVEGELQELLRLGFSIRFDEKALPFDKFVSIGTFEHVGKRFIPIFMKKVSTLLKRGGLGLLHTIGKEVDAGTDPWIDLYVFPGGYIPNLKEMVEHLAKTSLSVLHVENLRMHYARTLDCWIKNYERNAAQLQEMFGDVFVRMWRLYLNASSACFKYGTNRLYQILFSNGLTSSLPMTTNGSEY